MRRAVLALALIVLAPAVAAQDYIKLTPEQVGQIFCIATLGNDMAPVEALLTPDLAAAIEDAEAKDTAYEEQHPGDKPPLGDGIPWQDAPDYAADCTVGAVSLQSDEATVAISHGFPEYPKGNFTDILRLKLVSDPLLDERLWRIDNISYASKSDLRTLLKEIFEQ
jgi:hypothetical protein